MFYFLKKVRLFSQNDVLFLFYFLINPTMTTVCNILTSPTLKTNSILNRMFCFTSLSCIEFAQFCKIKDIKDEKTHQHLLKDVSHFHKEDLHHAETKERVVLPDSNSEYAATSSHLSTYAPRSRYTYK